MKTRILLILLGVVSTCVSQTDAQNQLPRSTPEEQGVSSEAIAQLVENLSEKFSGMHGLMILRHGHVIAEGWWAPYDASHNHVLYSLSKSFTSTAVGIAAHEGKLSVDDRIIDAFPDDLPSKVSKNLSEMRMRDLLTMTTGHQDIPSSLPDVISAKSFLAEPVPHLPGTYFRYNTAATFMQSAWVQKVTGETVLNYLKPRLFDPLGIGQPVWDENFQGISLGGYGLRLKTEDIAKFGQLYLQQGQWNGKQLIPQDWIAQATSKQTSNGSNPDSDWNQGYGFQFWQCRHQAYRGDGAFGQYCIVLPKEDLVIAINSGTGDMQAVLNVIWTTLLPELRPSPLQKNRKAEQALGETISKLAVPVAKGTATDATQSQYLNCEFRFTAPDSSIQNLVLSRSENHEMVVEITQDDQTLRFPAGHGEWKLGRIPLPQPMRYSFPDEPVATTYGWENENTLNIKMCAIETPFHWNFRLTFKDDGVQLESETNVAFGPTKRPTLRGHAKRKKE
jgi:CubicO group peptidase (beta-lactamase class C family)